MKTWFLLIVVNTGETYNSTEVCDSSDRPGPVPPGIDENLLCLSHDQCNGYNCTSKAVGVSGNWGVFQVIYRTKDL